MANQGRAKSIARRKTAKAAQSSSSSSSSSSSVGTVAGVNERGGIDKVSNKEANIASSVGGGSGGGSARGDDFAVAVEESGIGDIIRGGGGISFGDAIKQAQGGGLSNTDKISAILRNLNKNQQKGVATGALASDTMRVGGINTAQSESPSSTGQRSTRRVLTDKEVEEYAARGYREGDFVPGEGKLLPDGSFDTSNLELYNKLAGFQAEADRIQGLADNLTANEEAGKFDGIATDEPIVQQEEAAVAKLSEPETIISNSLALLDQLELDINERLKAEVKAAELTYQSDLTTTKEAQASESGQTSVGLAASGGYLGYSGSGTGVMLSLTKSHRAELQSLQITRDQAIAEARQAAAESRFDVVREKAGLVADIEKEAYRAQLKYNEDMKKASDKQEAEAKTRQTQTDIFNAIKNGATSVEDIFNSLDGAVDAGEISDFLKKTGAVEGGYSFTDTQVAKLLGSGMSGDDVKALNEYIVENGYDEVVRNSLTPAQRAAADKIFRSTEGTGTDKIFDFTDQEWRKLRQAGLMDAPWEDQANFLYGDNKPAYDSVYTQQILDGSINLNDIPFELQEDVRTELYSLGLGSPAIPEWYKDYVETEEQQNLTGDELKKRWNKFRNSSLGEEETPAESNSWWGRWSNSGVSEVTA